MILSHWPVLSVKIETTRPQKIREKRRISWLLRNIVLFAGYIQFTRKQSKIILPVGFFSEQENVGQ